MEPIAAHLQGPCATWESCEEGSVCPGGWLLGDWSHLSHLSKTLLARESL